MNPNYRTRTGRILTADDLDAIADEVEATDYDTESINKRSPGRPRIGSSAAQVVSFRIDPELRAALDAHADSTNTSPSEIIRSALREFLETT